jgi:phage terminase small subunit
MSLTDKQKRFVDAYLLEPNGTKAAIAAGYSEKSAAVESSRQLRNAKVAAAIEAGRRAPAPVAAQGQEEALKDRVIAELAKIGFSDIRDVVSWQANAVGMFEDENGEERLAVTNQVALKNSADLDPRVAAAVSEISQTKDGAIKVKLHAKLPALVKLGEHLGVFRAPAGAPTGDRRGKKEAAQEEAHSGDLGTGWESLVRH